MSTCQLTGKRGLRANRVSHANKKSGRIQLPNIQSKRIWVPEEGKFVRVSLSTRALRTVTRGGLYAFIRDGGLDFKTFGLEGPASN